MAICSTPEVPLDVKIKAFNPLIPGDADNSGIPIAFLDFELTNTSDKELNISTLRTETIFRFSDGNLFAYEGSSNIQGCCWGSCTHVWNDETATGFLIGDLAKTRREVEFAHATDNDGRKRSPFNEAECGHHYGRAMASWSAVLALTGFQYSVVHDEIGFNNLSGIYLWSTGYAWGNVEMNDSAGGKEVELIVLHGEIDIREFKVNGIGIKDFGETMSLKAGNNISFLVNKHQRG